MPSDFLSKYWAYKKTGGELSMRVFALIQREHREAEQEARRLRRVGEAADNDLKQLSVISKWNHGKEIY